MQFLIISTFKESVTAMKQKCDITKAVAFNLSVDQDTLGALKNTSMMELLHQETLI